MSKSAPPDRPAAGTPEFEALCTNCGKCCYKKIIVGRTVYITPFPCEFLDTATHRCTVYERRQEFNPSCLSIATGMKHSAFPADCGYVPLYAPPKYRPAREDLNWPEEFQDLDALADDLDVSPEWRERIRARGPDARPLYEETNERLKAEREQAVSLAELVRRRRD